MNRHASMNRIYRLVWSQVRSAWVPVAETARGRGKSGRARSIANRNVLAAAISFALAPLGHTAFAAAPCVSPACGAPSLSVTSHPSGGHVVSGAGSITQVGSTTDIRQSSTNLSIDWLSFSVGSQESVNFLQPSSSAVAVNRILGNNGTQILGHLDANGQVYLINPNGVIFGKGAEVNVGGLVASTLDVNDSVLSGGTRSFSGSGAGSIVNQGSINAANGGYVALIGNHVSNQGIITARLGTVALGAGNAVTLDFSGNRLVHLQVDKSTLNNLADNQQLIEADGGLVIMTAGAKNALLASVVNNTGIVEARTVENHDGTIELLGGMTAGTVNVGGTLDASAPTGGNGGFIETNAAHVEVANGTKVSTTAPQGLTGSWLIDPTDFTVAASGGDITGATLGADLNSTNFTILSSSGASPVTGGGSGGNININDAVSWTGSTTLSLTAANNVNVNSNMTASGTSAKLVINPNTANGTEAASGTGTFNLAAGASLTLSGATATLSIAAPNYNLGIGSSINLPNVSPTSTTALVIGGTSYTVINHLGAAGSTTGTDLQGINGNLSGHYAVGSNIDATITSSWNSGAGFTPLGNSTTPFTGIFDGLGHAVSNLYIHRPTTSNVGLFGYGSAPAVIRNVGLIGDTVSGANNVGGLVGSGYGGTINNTYATGNVTGAINVGGLVGGIGGCFMSCISVSVNGTVSNSYATGTVSGSSNVGGLVGANSYGTVSNSYATGAVTGSSNVGGLVGVIDYGAISNSHAVGKVSGSSSNIGGLLGYNYSGDVVNSFATGSVTGSSGSSGVGGLVGFTIGGPVFGSAPVSSSYATGPVSGGTGVGGLVGFDLGSVDSSYSTGRVSGSSEVGGLVGSGGGVTNGYWNTTTSGQSTSSGGTGLTTAQMQTASNFAGFTFTTTPSASGNNWVMIDADGTLNNAGGAAGAVLPMLASEYSTTITNAHQLQLMAMNLSSNYTLGQDINASATGNSSNVWSSSGFVPIGNSTVQFTGTFDGLGHTISNLTINRPTTSDVGLFGYTGGASVIRNVGLLGGSVSGSNDVGGLVGYNYGLTISNSYATGSVTGTSNVGGLVGNNYYYGTVSKSHATGSVTGSTFVGGLVGTNLGSTSNSYATGNVSGSSYVGGLVGGNSPGLVCCGSISNTYATGKVTGNTNVGGLVGYNSGFVFGSYATGSVSGTGNNVGGLVGYNNLWVATGEVSNSYATGNVSGSNYVGGLVGYSSGGVDNSYATGSVSGNSNVGGLVGGLVTTSGYFGTYGGISNSYATGSAKGTSNVGGLVGRNLGSHGLISNRYAVGHVNGTSNVGGLVGNSTGGSPVTNSFWDVTTSGQTASAGGIGMTTAQMQTQANFTSATSANGNVDPGWDFTNTWVMYDGHTYPLLRSFMTPLTVTANNAARTYSGSAFVGGNGVTYSVVPNGNLLGTVSYSGTSQGAINVGTYTITPGGLYSNQQGYIINDVSGTLSIAQLASVAWVGGASGNWSNAANWAGGAIPDLSNVAAVTIPKGTTVTYDAGVLGTTILTTLTDSGKLVMAAGDLSTTGNLSTAGYTQSGGLLNVGGTLSITSTAGAITLGNIDAGTLSVTSKTGAITQLAGTALDVTGASSLTADNGVSGAGDVKYNITLANATNRFSGAVTAVGGTIALHDTAALTAALTSVGAVSLTSAGPLFVSGTVGTNLTTVTTGGTGSTTIFGNTRVGKYLKVTSTGAVTEALGDELLVHGAGTDATDPVNTFVTVNGKKGAHIQ